MCKYSNQYNSVLFSNKKQWRADTFYDENKSCEHLANWKKPDIRPHNVQLHLYEMSRIDTSIETESRLPVA